MCRFPLGTVWVIRSSSFLWEKWSMLLSDPSADRLIDVLMGWKAPQADGLLLCGLFDGEAAEIPPSANSFKTSVQTCPSNQSPTLGRVLLVPSFPVIPGNSAKYK
ncbi:hypothetical protein ILYODFUR_015182 [Ilyodon furcidens]|uniref:Uncharacterized protein n=1 Tax=Ilyodon furcidens TaxID=33524 RepID=A0ABV0VE67_9TELE